MKNLNKNLIIILISFFVFEGATFANKMVLPRIINNKIFIGETIQNLITKKIPDFKIFENKNFSKEIFTLKINNPMAITGDFNDDRLRDIAFYGYSEKDKKIYVFVALSNKNEKNFNLVKLYEDDFFPELLTANTMYLNLGKKDKKLGVKRDLVQIETYQNEIGSVDPYYYSKSKKTMVRFLGKMD